MDFPGIPLSMLLRGGGDDERQYAPFPADPEGDVATLRAALAMLEEEVPGFKPGDAVVLKEPFAFTSPEVNCEPRVFVQWGVQGYPPITPMKPNERKYRPDCMVLIKGDEGRVGIDYADSRMLRRWTPEVGREMVERVKAMREAEAAAEAEEIRSRERERKLRESTEAAGVA